MVYIEYFPLRNRFPFLKVAIAAVASVSVFSGASLTHVEDMKVTATMTSMQLPKWSNGALVAARFGNPKSPSIWMFDRRGERQLSFSVPGAESTLIYDCDLGADGTIGISGSAIDSEKRVAGFVAWISADGTSSRIIRTGLYRPAMVTVAPDGTLWTVGKETTNLTSPVEIIPHAGVVRHFDRSGSMMGAYVQQYTIRNPILTLSGSRNTLRASKDRIAWYSVDGKYVEISLAGKILMDIALGIPLGDGKPLTDRISFALTNDGDAILSVPYVISSSKDEISRTYVLDRAAGAWKHIQTTTEQPSREGSGYIYGVDGRRVVFMRDTIVQFYAIGK